jgi:FKBP-type peptidyl-prolyl cis-trans isomerase (trigger factor)
MQERLQSQGLRLDRYFQYLGQTPEQWLAQARPDAESRLKVDMVLEEIGRQEGIEPSEEDVLAHMQQEASRDKELGERFTELATSRAARDYFKHRLTRIRILERLVQRASGEYSPQTAAVEGAGAAPEPAQEEQSGGSDAGR